MAPLFIQGNVGPSGTGTPFISQPFTSPLTYGNTGLIGISYVNNGVFATVVSDDIGNSYALLRRYTATQRIVEWWIANGLIAGAATVTVQFSGGKSSIGLWLSEYQPDAGFIFAEDQFNQQQSLSNVTSFPHGSITTTENVEVILAISRINEVGTVPAGYTARYNTGGNVTVFDQITTATVTTNPTPTGAIGTRYSAMVLSLKQVADTSGLQLTQQAREVQYVESTIAIQMTQMAREVIYPYTCVSGDTSALLTQLPLEIAYDYAVLQPYVKGQGLNWVTPPKPLT